MSGMVNLLWGEQPKVTRRHDEDDLQRSIVQFLRVALPDDATFYHPANGGLRSKVAAARLVGLGVRAGVPDLVIEWRGPPHRSIYIELKTIKGTLSEHQKQFHKKLIHCGCEVLTCRSLQCVESGLIELGIPLKARVAT